MTLKVRVLKRGFIYNSPRFPGETLYLDKRQWFSDRWMELLDEDVREAEAHERSEKGEPFPASLFPRDTGAHEQGGAGDG